MSLPVNITELIHARIIESERIDFKEGFNDEALLHTICAFANDINNWGGGYIVMGIADDGSGRPVLPPKGLESGQIDSFQKKIIELCHKIEPIYFPVISHEVFMDKDILVLWGSGGDNRPYKAPVSMRKGTNKAYFVRHGCTTKIASTEEEQQLIEAAARIPFDDRINHTASISDFDILQLKAYLQDTGSELYNHLESMTLEEICKSMHLVKGPDEDLRPVNIGILFFSKEPQRLFKTAVIDLVQFADDTGDNFTEKTFSGPVHRQLIDVTEFIKNQIIQKRVRKIEGKAESEVYYNYPFAAIEESLANAVYHKGYDTPEPIEVRVLPDKIEILSCPGPVPPVNSDNLKTGRVVARRYRNRRIGDFLKELKLTEGRGTGLLKIKNSLAKNGSGPAVFDTDNNSYFTTTIPIHPDFIGKAAPSDVLSNDTDNKGIIDILSQACPKLVLSSEMLSIIEALLENDSSKKELLGLSTDKNVSRFTEKHITPLMDEGLIEYTNPEAPKSPNQKYRLTNKIKKLLGK